MDKERVFSCAYTILDNIQAIIYELNRKNPYKGYLEEKLGPIKNDIIVLENEINKEENNG